MKKYTCNICGYVYDPAVGDPENGVAAGTPFEKIPDSGRARFAGRVNLIFLRKSDLPDDIASPPIRHGPSTAGNFRMGEFSASRFPSQRARIKKDR